MALNVKKVKLDLHRYFGHELDLIIKNHPYLDYNHGSRLYNMIALQDSRTMEECFDADLLSKVSNALQNRRSSTSRQTELENNTTNNNRQEQNNLPDSENVSVVVSSSSSEESIVKSDQISAAKTDNVTQITPEITNDSVELNSQILTSANDEKKVENSSSQLPETSDKEDKSNEMKTLNSENTMETETTLKPTESKNDDHSDDKSDSNETRLESDDQEEVEEEEEDEEDKIGKQIRYCVCEKKYESLNSALCDRCSNLYHLQCAGDEAAKNAFKNRKNSREPIPFVCFKCRRNTQLIKKYESELKASGRWDSDCEEALSDENENNESSGDDVFLLSEHEGTSATKPSVVRKSRTVSAEKRKSVEESVDWIKSKSKEPNQTKLVSNLVDKRKITRTKHVPISKAAETLSKKVSSLQQQAQLQKTALKSNSHGSIDSIKQMRRGSKSSINSQQTTTTKPVLQTQTSLSQSNEEKHVSLLQSDFEKRLSGEATDTGTRLSETELRTLCQSIYNEYKKHFADISLSKFHMKITSLRSNLADVKNRTFYRKILNGSIVPSKLPEMSSADMMDDSLKDEEKRQEEAKLRMIIDQNVEHNVALLRHISEVNEKLGFSKLAGIDCDQETLLQTATSTRRDSLEKKQQSSESQITDEAASTASAAPIEHSNRKKLNSKLEELSEKIAEEIVVKSTAEKDKLAVDLTLKRATSIPTSPSLEKPSESGAAISSKTDESAKKISSPQISSTASAAQVKPTQSIQKPEETKTTPTKSIETIKKAVVPNRTIQPVQTENNPSKISAPLRQASITSPLSSSKSPSPNINNTESVSVTKPPLEISNTNRASVAKPPETLAIAKPTQIAESKQTPSPSNSPTIKLASPLLINRSLSSQSANASPSQVQPNSPAPEDELLAKLPPLPPPPPVQFTEYRMKVFIELEKSFCVSTQWRNVIETGNKKKERAFTHTPTIANYLMKHRKVNLKPRDGVRDPNVERIWPVLFEREAYVVFEVRPNGERESYQWLNNQYKSELTSDEVIFGTLKDAVEFAIAPHLSAPSKPVKCVRCFVPNELASIVEHIYLVWVAEKKGSKDLQENHRIPLDREQSRILCLMFIKTPSSSSSSTPVISPLATTTSISSTLLSRSTSIEAGIKRKVSTSTTPSIPEAPQTSESVESKKPKVDQPQPKVVLRDPRLIRPNETTAAANTPSVFEALKRLFRDIQAGKTEALTSVESLASDVDKLSDAEKLELRNEFQKIDSLKSLIGRLYDRGSEDMDICSPEPEAAQVASVSVPSEPSKDEQPKSSVEKDDEKKAPAASLNDADLLIQQLKTAPTNKKITVHLPKSIKENPKELVKFYEFVNGKKHINISLDNENWRLTENYFTVEKPTSISAEGVVDETAERRSKSQSDDDDWSDTEAFRPQEPAENRSSRDRSRHSNERDSRRDSWHTSRSNKSRSRSRSRAKLFSDRDSYSARGLADRFRGRGRGGPSLFRGRGRGRGGAAYYNSDRYNKDRYRK